jgi:predicted phage tail protein
MDDLNKNKNLEVRGAGGGGGGGQQKIKQNVTVVAPTRQPVIAANNLFSVAFAKTVYALGEGVIEGFPNEIEKDVYLNSVPIKNPDGTDNFVGYDLDHRLGEDETQTPIQGFNTTENTIGVGVEVTQSTPIIQRIVDTDVERCRVIISHPALLAQNQSNGDISGTTVSYKIEVNSNGGQYDTKVNATVTGKSDSEFQRAYEFDLEGTGPWDIKVTRLTANSNSSFLQNSINWQALVEIIDEKFAYPNTALVALKVDARQFNSIPDLSVRLRGKRVQVPTNYDAAARTYEGIWDGTFQMAWTDNPAWIFRDIVVNDRFGVARYVNSISIDPWYLYSVSQHCDELVSNGAGGTEPRFTCNVYLQNAGGVYEVLNALASCFRGLIYYSEGQLYLTQDREQLPVQQFSEANVIQDVAENGEVASPCFTYSGSARAARKTVVLANWDDPNQAYSSVTEYQQDDELLERFGYNPVDLRLVGVTSRAQALRAAKHTLFSDRYETERVSFRIGAEGLAAGVGEIIQISDPLKQGQRLGGRVLEVDGDTVVLDAALTLDPAITYTLTLVVPDGITKINKDGTRTTRPRLKVFDITGHQTTDSTTEVTLDEPATTQVGAIWVLEWSEKQAALYRIVSVAEVDPLVYQVDAIQYNSSKYDYVDNNLPIAIPKDRFTIQAAQVPVGVQAKLDFSNGQTSIFATWKAPQRDNSVDLSTRGYRYQWRKNNDTEWSDLKEANATHVEIPLATHVFGSSYQVRVATVNRLGNQSDWVEYAVDDFDAIPNLSAAEYEATVTHANQPDGTQLIIVNPGSCPIPERVSGFTCWVRPRTLRSGEIPGVKEPGENDWYFLADIPLTGYYTVAFHAPDTYDIRVNFVSSIFGETPTDYIYDVVERGEIAPPTPSNFGVVENQNSSGKRFSWLLPVAEYGSWDQEVVADVVGYEVRYKSGTLSLNNLAISTTTGTIQVTTSTVNGTRTNQHLFTVGDEIVFGASNGTPSAITAGTTYYVASDDFSSTDFKITATPGGSPIDLSAGIPSNSTLYVNGPEAAKRRLDTQASWGAGLELASGGLPAQQQWFETSLFDVGTYVVMVKAVDATQWRSDIPAYVLVNIGAPPISNAVETINVRNPTDVQLTAQNGDVLTTEDENGTVNTLEIVGNSQTTHPGNWPGSFINASVQNGVITQDDPTLDSYFNWNFDNNESASALLLSTTADATYSHSLVALTGQAIELAGISVQAGVFNILQEDDSKLLAEQRYYTDTELSDGGIVHPYAPYEKLTGDVYRVQTRFKSLDGGVTAGTISAMTAELDYPDVVEKINDAVVSSASGGTAVSLTKTFRSVKSVSVTALQVQGSTAVTARIVSKTTDAITVECLDSSGAAVAGTVDLIVTGY